MFFSFSLLIHFYYLWPVLIVCFNHSISGFNCGDYLPLGKKASRNNILDEIMLLIANGDVNMTGSQERMSRAENGEWICPIHHGGQPRSVVECWLWHFQSLGHCMYVYLLQQWQVFCRAMTSSRLSRWRWFERQICLLVHSNSLDRSFTDIIDWCLAERGVHLSCLLHKWRTSHRLTLS